MIDDPDLLLTSAPLQLLIDVEAVGDDLVVVTVRGDIDLSEAGELRAVLNDACTGPHRSVAVDLSAVRFIGSTGMAVLAESAHRLAEEGRHLLVSEPPETIRHAFAIAGLDHLFEEGTRSVNASVRYPDEFVHRSWKASGGGQAQIRLRSP